MPRQMNATDVIKDQVYECIRTVNARRGLAQPTEIDYAKRIVRVLFESLDDDEREGMLLLLMHRDEAMRQASPSQAYPNR